MRWTSRTLTGILLIGAGVVSNEWVLARFLTGDGSIDDPLFVALILGFQLVLIVAGAGVLLRSKDQLKTDLAAGSLLLLSVLLGWALIEGVLRTPWLSLPVPKSLPIYEQNPSTGLFYPRSNLALTAPIRDGTVDLSTNQHGMRWPPVEVTKPKNRRRIAFLGDSHTYGMWSTDPQSSFVGVFSRRVRSRGYEVLNFGVPAYGLEEMKLMLRDRVLAFDPDVVFLMFYPGNDIKDTYLGVRRLRVVDGVTTGNERYIQNKIPGSAHGSKIGFRARLKTMLRSLKTYQLLDLLVASYTDEESVERLRANESINVDVEFWTPSYWSKKRYPPLGQKALRTTLGELDAIRRICEQNDIILLIGSTPHKPMVYVQREEGPRFSIWLPQKHVETYAQQHEIPYVDLLPALRREAANTDASFFVWRDTHMNNRGHRIAGNRLADFFTSNTVSRHLRTHFRERKRALSTASGDPRPSRSPSPPNRTGVPHG